MNDAMEDIAPYTKYSEFSKTFNFKVPLPSMIRDEDAIRIDFPDFLIRRFKKYLLSTRKTGRWFKHLFPRGIKNAIADAIPERFTYKYSYENNAITLKLRTFWILVLTYGIGEALKHINKEHKVENTEKFFFDRVKELKEEVKINVKEFFK
jgi:hypothetical protein